MKELRLASSFINIRFFSNCSKTDVLNNCNTNRLLTEAKLYEDAFDIKKATKIYEKIIYERDPTCKEAYGRLMNIWLTYSSACGLKQESLDRYMEQYDRYMLPFKDESTRKLDIHT